MTSDELPAMTGALAVVAHPDDESFGLGAVISKLVERGIPVTVLCFAHGEASTLHAAAGLPVLAWAVPQPVADRINAELGTAFTGRPNHELTVLSIRGLNPSLTHTPRGMFDSSAPSRTSWRNT